MLVLTRAALPCFTLWAGMWGRRDGDAPALLPVFLWSPSAHIPQPMTRGAAAQEKAIKSPMFWREIPCSGHALSHGRAARPCINLPHCPAAIPGPASSPSGRQLSSKFTYLTYSICSVNDVPCDVLLHSSGRVGHWGAPPVVALSHLPRLWVPLLALPSSRTHTAKWQVTMSHRYQPQQGA